VRSAGAGRGVASPREASTAGSERSEPGVAYDFVFDALPRQTLKCLTVVDEFTRECLAIDVREPPFGSRDRGVVEGL